MLLRPGDVQPGAGDRMPLTIGRNMNGHRTGQVPEFLGGGAVPERAELLRYRKVGPTHPH
ncbi:MAG: hypothetical protein Q7U51_04100 [Methanoregula sp.]|nr:hypothetical protein [Methanoregula sp.]